MFNGLDESAKQTEFGRLVGVSQKTVSGLVAKGVVKEGGTYFEWIQAYTASLREMAAGRGGEEQGRLAAARVRETELKGDKLELEIAMSAETLVDAEELEEFFASMVLSARSEMMSLTAKIADHIQAEHNVEIDKGFINGLIRGTLTNLERGGSEDNE